MAMILSCSTICGLCNDVLFSKVESKKLKYKNGGDRFMSRESFSKVESSVS